ncbi:serine/threonine-protein kinase [Caballeronia sp. BR00000012568055]|uniref:serine/threonine-protein kinase n=1 Tax=Caballeronia sp. BR00000012568055 TaxID=2918761 RepID=UPI0023F923B5|nr:serine/threonine-protein kinase [Caballeronia sp. BR00000012568055]
MSDDAEDKTVIVAASGGGKGAPPTTSAALAAPSPMPMSPGLGNALPPGARLAEFEIVSLIGEGGFGIVYLAHDTSLDRHVAVKEYMPAMLASRIHGTHVEVKSDKHAEAFGMGLKSFINEARILARFDHPALVKVFRFWEGNGTAYMAMPYFKGATLRDTLRAMPAPPDEAWLRALLAPLIEAIGVLHREHCWHRDIAPDNIMLLEDGGRPVLLDFGSARRVIGDMTQALTAFLKPGYAPIEQYAEIPALKQGPWSDIYALGALVYFAILGKTPPPAVGRIVEDDFVPLSVAAPPGYSPALMRAVDHALALWPDARTRCIKAFETTLNAAGETDRLTQTAQSAPATKPKQRIRPKVTPRMPPITPAQSAHTQPSVTPRPAARAWRAGLLVSAALAAALLIGPEPMERRAPASRASGLENAPERRSDAVPPPLAGSQIAAEIAAGIAPEIAPPAHAPLPPTIAPPAAEPPALPAPSVPWTPVAELDRIAAHADPARHVEARVPSVRAVAEKDKLKITLSSAQNGYLYLFMVDADGQYSLLFPNLLDHDNAITAGHALTLPGPKWPMVVGKPLGDMQFLALVSSAPRVFRAPALTPVSVFGEFGKDAAPATLDPNAPSPFAGQPDCAGPVPECPPDYGAARFKIEVVRSSK